MGLNDDIVTIRQFQVLEGAACHHLEICVFPLDELQDFWYLESKGLLVEALLKSFLSIICHLAVSEDKV